MSSVIQVVITKLEGGRTTNTYSLGQLVVCRDAADICAVSIELDGQELGARRARDCLFIRCELEDNTVVGTFYMENSACGAPGICQLWHVKVKSFDEAVLLSCLLPVKWTDGGVPQPVSGAELRSCVQEANAIVPLTLDEAEDHSALFGGHRSDAAVDHICVASNGSLHSAHPQRLVLFAQNDPSVLSPLMNSAAHDSSAKAMAWPTHFTPCLLPASPSVTLLYAQASCFQEPISWSVDQGPYRITFALLVCGVGGATSPAENEQYVPCALRVTGVEYIDSVRVPRASDLSVQVAVPIGTSTVKWQVLSVVTAVAQPPESTVASWNGSDGQLSFQVRFPKTGPVSIVPAALHVPPPASLHLRVKESTEWPWLPKDVCLELCAEQMEYVGSCVMTTNAAPPQEERTVRFSLEFEGGEDVLHVEPLSLEVVIPGKKPSRPTRLEVDSVQVPASCPVLCTQIRFLDVPLPAGALLSCVVLEYGESEPQQRRECQMLTPLPSDEPLDHVYCIFERWPCVQDHDHSVAALSVYARDPQSDTDYLLTDSIIVDPFQQMDDVVHTRSVALSGLLTLPPGASLSEADLLNTSAWHDLTILQRAAFYVQPLCVDETNVLYGCPTGERQYGVIQRVSADELQVISMPDDVELPCLVKPVTRRGTESKPCIFYAHNGINSIVLHNHVTVYDVRVCGDELHLLWWVPWASTPGAVFTPPFVFAHVASVENEKDWVLCSVVAFDQFQAVLRLPSALRGYDRRQVLKCIRLVSKGGRVVEPVDVIGSTDVDSLPKPRRLMPTTSSPSRCKRSAPAQESSPVMKQQRRGRATSSSAKKTSKASAAPVRVIASDVEHEGEVSSAASEAATPAVPVTAAPPTTPTALNGGGTGDTLPDSPLILTETCVASIPDDTSDLVPPPYSPDSVSNVTEEEKEEATPIETARVVPVNAAHEVENDLFEEVDFEVDPLITAEEAAPVTSSAATPETVQAETVEGSEQSPVIQTRSHKRLSSQVTTRASPGKRSAVTTPTALPVIPGTGLFFAVRGQRVGLDISSTMSNQALELRRNLRHWWNFYVLPEERRVLFELIERQFSRTVNASRKAFAMATTPMNFDGFLEGSVFTLIFAVRVAQERDSFRYTLRPHYTSISKVFQREGGVWYQAMMIKYFNDVFKGSSGFLSARRDTIAFVLLFAAGQPYLMPLDQFLKKCTPFEIEQQLDGEPADSKCFDLYQRFWSDAQSLFRFE